MPKAKLVTQITVIDPDTQAEVIINIYKEEGGGMIGIDESYIDTEQPVFSPFDGNGELEIIE